MKTTPFFKTEAAPILRWAGSKRRITPILKAHAPTGFKRYIEPFAGSAAFFFSLKPPVAILGDVNPEVTATYQATKDSPEAVAAHLSEIPQTKDAYLTLRELEVSKLTTAQRAARLIFLMKSCFNGVYRTNVSGGFNVPFGSTFYKLPTLAELQQVSKSLDKTEIQTGDYKDWMHVAGKGDFVYLDPPYSASSRYRGEYGYKAKFRDEQLEVLLLTCEMLTNAGAKVMLSYKWDEQVVKSLRGWHILHLEVPRSVSCVTSGRSPASELLAMNY